MCPRNSCDGRQAVYDVGDSMRVIVVIHGIRSPKKGSWIYDFCEFGKKDPRFKGDVFLPYHYGYLLALNSINLVTRYNYIRGFMKFLRNVRKDYPNADVSILAHSYGTERSFQAIKRS